MFVGVSRGYDEATPLAFQMPKLEGPKRLGVSWESKNWASSFSKVHYITNKNLLSVVGVAGGGRSSLPANKNEPMPWPTVTR